MLHDTAKKRILLLTLLLVVPFLTELLSGNTPLPKFINPAVFGYLVVMYGFPVLLAREAFVAKGLSWGGLFVLGLAYGILNEGVAARTLLLSDEHMFMPSLRGYETFGINLPWAMAILPWHALFSVMYPIILIGAAYPDSRNQRWLSRRACIGLASAVIVLGSLSYFGTDLYPATSPLYLFAFWLAVIGLIAFAWRMTDFRAGASEAQAVARRPIRAFLFGISLIGLMIIPLLLPVFSIPEALQLIIALLFLVGAGRLFFRYFAQDPSSWVWVVFGHYGIASLIPIFILWPIGLPGAVIVWLILGAFWLAIRKNRISQESSDRTASQGGV